MIYFVTTVCPEKYIKFPQQIHFLRVLVFRIVTLSPNLINSVGHESKSTAKIGRKDFIAFPKNSLYHFKNLFDCIK